MAFHALLTSGSTSLINDQVVTDLGSLLSSVTGWITGNDFLMWFFTVSLVGVGVAMFRSLKRLVKQ